jgi:hypothetical protein
MQGIILNIATLSRPFLDQQNDSLPDQPTPLCHSFRTLLLLVHNRNLLLIGILVMNLFLHRNNRSLGQFFVFEHYCISLAHFFITFFLLGNA